MRWSRASLLGIGLGLAFALFGFFPSLQAGEVVLRSVQIKKPIAILLEINGTGELTRNGTTYTINAAGAGFKKGDIFTVPVSSTGDHYAVIALNRAASEDETSYVRLEEGARIVFLDDDGAVAITGVYVESTTTSAPSSLVFYINHASPQSPFFVWTPDLVVGVRGTYFEIKPANASLDYPTEVVGYNEVDDSETVILPISNPDRFDPDDIKLILSKADEIIIFIKNLGVPSIPNIVTGGNISVASLNPSNIEHVVSAYSYIERNYFNALKNIVNGVANQLSLGTDIVKVSDDEVITYHSPESFIQGFINEIFSGLINKPVVLKAIIPPPIILGFPTITLDVTYLLTDNPACISDGGTCKYTKYQIGPTVSLYDVLTQNQNISKMVFKKLVTGFIDKHAALFSLLSIEKVADDKIKIGSNVFRLGWFSGACPMLNPEAVSCCYAIMTACDLFTNVVLKNLVKVKFFFAVDKDEDHRYVLLNEHSDTLIITKPGVKIGVTLEKTSSGNFVYPKVRINKVFLVEEEKKMRNLKKIKRKHDEKKKKMKEKILKKADKEDADEIED